MSWFIDVWKKSSNWFITQNSSQDNNDLVKRYERKSELLKEVMELLISSAFSSWRKWPTPSNTTTSFRSGTFSLNPHSIYSLMPVKLWVMSRSPTMNLLGTMIGLPDHGAIEFPASAVKNKVLKEQLSGSGTPPKSQRLEIKLKRGLDWTGPEGNNKWQVMTYLSKIR